MSLRPETFLSCAGKQHVSLLQLLPETTQAEGKACGIISKLQLTLSASESLLLAQPILQSRESTALVILTDQQAVTTTVHLLNLNRECRPSGANRVAHWVKALECASYDDRTRCLALFSRQEEVIQVFTFDTNHTQLRPATSISMPWLPQLTSIRLVPGRKVCLFSSSLAKFGSQCNRPPM